MLWIRSVYTPRACLVVFEARFVISLYPYFVLEALKTVRKQEILFSINSSIYFAVTETHPRSIIV
jgi:DNA polymerase III sliding clamp (beta) subunit (PCNA family)